MRRREFGDMKERYRGVAVVAAVLFLVGAIGGLLGSGAFASSATNQWRTGFVVFLLVGAVMVVTGYWWSRRFAIGRVTGDLLLTVAIGCVLSVLLVPMVESATAKGKWHAGLMNPFAGGPGIFFGKIWLFLGCGLGGALLGVLVCIAFGQDYRSKALRQYTSTATARPRRAVRR